MMDRLREGVNSIAVKIILGLIILSFIFTGVGGLVGNGGNAAAKVGNNEIPRGEFEIAYQNERNRMQAQMGDYFAQLLADPAYVEQFRRSVLDRMINDALIDQQAQSMGLRVSDAQVRSEILAMTEFQRDGQFDQEIYQAALRRAGFTPDSFASYMRSQMVRDQLMAALSTSEFSLPNEIALQGKLFTQTRDIRTLTIGLQEFADKVTLNEEQIQQYYEQNPEMFTRPEQVKVSYVELSANALKEQIEISDEQAEQHYQQQLDKYSSAEQRRVSHILLSDAAAADAVAKTLAEGADFAELAKEKSEDFGSAENGGDLGFIERGVMDPAFEDAAFALTNVGDVSAVVESDFGFHIIKLDELTKAQAKPFAEVSAQIKAELRDSQAVEQFYQLQTELEKVAFEYPDSLDDAANAVNLPVQTTDFISQIDAPEVLQNPAIAAAIESPEVKEDGLNSEAIEIAPEHILVVRVEDVRDETVLPLQEVQAQVVAELSRVKGEEQAVALADKVVADLNAGNDAVLAENGLSFGESEQIDRSSNLAMTVFAMPKPQADKPVFAKNKAANGDITVIELDAVTAELDPAIVPQVAAQLERVSSQQDLASVIAVLRANADIEYFVVSN
ncbi:peptidylprolyl isomerase [Vibrio sp. SM6]|uniref:Periplasmic chaperone PpiD n=1 Tax=Vibrio agarilyticus TaxID=2726741 RepID=A0A7X8TSC2_9VIBR|nr:peptidylprolyl isomerase [Vibrio agarilyticus]NLS13879.1 peptidylprolyl isomerase [Vibrio agarilyticus]